MIVAAAHFRFWSLPAISSSPRLTLPLESPQNGTQPCPLLEVVRTWRTSPYFFHIPFTAIQRILFGHSGNEWERDMFAFHWFLIILASFWASLVIVAAAHFGFWGVPGISNAPRIIVPLGEAHKMASNCPNCMMPQTAAIGSSWKRLSSKHRQARNGFWKGQVRYRNV